VSPQYGAGRGTANFPEAPRDELQEVLLVTILGTDDREIVRNEAELPVGEIARLIIEHAVPAVRAYVAANQPDAAEVERLRAQREAVLALHRGFRGYRPQFPDVTICMGCPGDKTEWPCDTAAALGVEDV
jgi:hypothetical protein